jgi:hypothetical protein
MNNGEKNLIKDYLAKYPVMRYIMPSFTNNGKDISHRLLILRQAYWVLSRIIDHDGDPAELDKTKFYDGTKADKGTNSATVGTSTTDVFKETLKIHDATKVGELTNGLAKAYIATNNLGLTHNDVQLLALFLNIAKNNCKDNQLSTYNAIDAELKKQNIPYNATNFLAYTTSTTYKELLAVFADQLNFKNNYADKIKLLQALAEAYVIPALETADSAGVISLVEILNYDNIHKLDVKSQHDEKLFYNVDIRELFFTQEYTVAKTAITGSSLSKIGQLITGSTVARYPALLTTKAITTPKSGDIYLICVHHSNSLFHAIGPVSPSITSETVTINQDQSGLFKITTKSSNGTEKTDDFTEKFNELVQNDNFCRAFGALTDKPGESDACANLVVSCLGKETHNADTCKFNFLKIAKPTKGFRAWSSLTQIQKQYASYRILLGLEIYGVYNKDGNYSYYKDGNLIYTSDIIKKIIPGAKDEHIEYINTLMKNVGTLETPTKSNSSSKPRYIVTNKKPSVLTFYPANLNLGGINIRGMHGGADQKQEIQQNQLSHILYGGGREDIEKIILGINNKMAYLTKNYSKAMSPDNIEYIMKKIRSFETLGDEIDKLEAVIAAYISIAAQYPNKEITITENEIKLYKNELENKQNKIVSKNNNFDKLFGGIILMQFKP